MLRFYLLIITITILFLSACRKKGVESMPSTENKNVLVGLQENKWKINEDWILGWESGWCDSFSHLDYLLDCQKDDFYIFTKDSVLIDDNQIQCITTDSIHAIANYSLDTTTSPWFFRIDTTDYEVVEWTDTQFKIRNRRYEQGWADSVYIYKNFEIDK